MTESLIDDMMDEMNSDQSATGTVVGVENRGLPDFDNPPVVEVALSVQFEPVELSPDNLIQIALDMRAAGYPRLEEHAPLQPVFEQFSESAGEVQHVILQMGAATQRRWHVSEDNNRLIQLQPDRFVHNWRKADTGAPYPRYESIRELFKARLDEFRKYLVTSGIDDIAPNQAEITYVNHVMVEPGEELPRLTDVVRLAGVTPENSFLPAPEDMRVGARYRILREDKPIGRLHINGFHGVDKASGSRVLVVNLTARGLPTTPDVTGALHFLDLGREWVVRGFADITTPAMHKKWGRKQ